MSERYKIIQSFKLYFLQNSPIVQLYASASDCKGVGSISGSHFVKDFSAISFLMMSVPSQKCHPFTAEFSQGNT